MRASYLIIALVLTSLVAGSISIFITDISNNYDVTYNDSDLQLFNKLNDTQAVAQDLHEKINQTETDTGIFDVIGDWVTKAVDSLKLVGNSVSAGNQMIGSAIEVTGMPSIYSTALKIILLVMFVLGIIVSIMVKKDV